MKILVIEDEQLTAEDLMDMIVEVDPTIEILPAISSVQEGINFFSESRDVDLIFSDIQLGDGLSFEIFKQVTIQVPIIFCTAYDEYAIEAFKVNGIDYILKPFGKKSIEEALSRYRLLKKAFNVAHQDDVIQSLSMENSSNSTILVHHRDKVIPLDVSEIALIYIRNELIYIHTFAGDHYVVSKSLDEMEQTLGNNFYRANRQYIVNRKVVKDLTTLVNRKYQVNLTIPFDETIMVSKEKMTAFLKWLKQ